MGIMRVLTKGKKDTTVEAPPQPPVLTPPAPVIVQPPPVAIPAPEEELFDDKYKVFDIADFVANEKNPYVDAKFKAAYCNILLGIFGELKELNKNLKEQA